MLHPHVTALPVPPFLPGFVAVYDTSAAAAAAIVYPYLILPHRSPLHWNVPDDGPRLAAKHCFEDPSMDEW
jgi:hypothetical protein